MQEGLTERMSLFLTFRSFVPFFLSSAFLRLLQTQSKDDVRASSSPFLLPLLLSEALRSEANI